MLTPRTLTRRAGRRRARACFPGGLPAASGPGGLVCPPLHPALGRGVRPILARWRAMETWEGADTGPPGPGVCWGSPLLQERVGASHAPSLDGPGVSTLGASRANRICSSGSSGACSPAYGHLRNHSLLLPGRGAGQMRAFRINFISIFIPEWVSTRERSRMKN